MNGLPSYLTPSAGLAHEPGKPWIVRLSDGSFVEVPWNEQQGLFVGLSGGSPPVVTTDPNVREAFRDDSRTRGLQAAAKIATTIAGGAYLSGLGGAGATSTGYNPAYLPAESGFGGAAGAGGFSGASGASTASGLTAAGLPTGAASASGGGMGSMTGGVPSVGSTTATGGGGMSFLEKLQQFSNIPGGSSSGYQQPQQPQGRRYQNAIPAITVTPREQLMADRLMRRY